LVDRRKIVVVLKGYPRLSETFIAQELLGLERAGFDLVLVALRRPTDSKRHPVHDEIKAPVHYLPEYLHEEPVRVLAALSKGMPKSPVSGALLSAFIADLPQGPDTQPHPPFRPGGGAGGEWPDDAHGCMPISSTRRHPWPPMPA
jgi:hypothetical protein